MGQLLQRAELALEAIEQARVDPAQHLEREAHVVVVIVHLVDFAHAARAEQPDDLEALGAFEMCGQRYHGK